MVTSLFGDLVFSGLPTTVAVAAVGAFAYLAGLMSRLDEVPPEQLRDLDHTWQDGAEWAEMTDEVLAVTRKALKDSRRLTEAAQVE
jgi:hypothetical protein